MEISPEEQEHALLSWRLIEWKVAYYMPEKVHPTRRAELEIPDAEYDAHEQRYLSLCRALGVPNTVVHKGYPGFDDIDYSRAMVEVDATRPSVQLVLRKLGSPKRKATCKKRPPVKGTSNNEPRTPARPQSASKSSTRSRRAGVPIPQPAST